MSIHDELDPPRSWKDAHWLISTTKPTTMIPETYTGGFQGSKRTDSLQRRRDVDTERVTDAIPTARFRRTEWAATDHNKMVYDGESQLRVDWQNLWLWDGPRTGINHGRSKEKSKLFRKKTCIISTSYIVHSSRNNCHSAYNCHKFCATSIVAVRRCSKEAI